MQGYRLLEREGDDRQISGVTFDPRVLQLLVRIHIELTNVWRPRLNALATEIVFTQFRETVGEHLTGGAPARVIGEPAPVKGKRQLMRDNDRIPHDRGL